MIKMLELNEEELMQTTGGGWGVPDPENVPYVPRSGSRGGGGGNHPCM